jgi:acetate kinase
MGFTPSDGMMMGTRSGAIDPGILLHLLEHHSLGPRELREALNNRSGLHGVSGISSDFRKVMQAAEEGNDRAQLAIDLFADHVRSAIGALAVTLGGIDALVFTAGIGEHSASPRWQFCQGLDCLGLELDEAKNQISGDDRDLSGDQSEGRVLVIRTQEERMIARESVRVDSSLESI